MTLMLNLGVISVPYTNETDERDHVRSRMTKKGRVHRQDAKRIQNYMEGKTDDAPPTTVSVAQALEDRYGVMAAFATEYEDEIVDALVHSAEGALEDIFAGSPVTDPFAEAGQEIAEGFRYFLMSGEIETMGIEGVPTKAAQERKSARFKKGEGPNERPSFVSTGTYEAAFRAWTE